VTPRASHPQASKRGKILSGQSIMTFLGGNDIHFPSLKRVYFGCELILRFDQLNCLHFFWALFMRHHIRRGATVTEPRARLTPHSHYFLDSPRISKRRMEACFLFIFAIRFFFSAPGNAPQWFVTRIYTFSTTRFFPLCGDSKGDVVRAKAYDCANFPKFHFRNFQVNHNMTYRIYFCTAMCLLRPYRGYYSLW
jgi:hypothetical protein